MNHLSVSFWWVMDGRFFMLLYIQSVFRCNRCYCFSVHRQSLSSQGKALLRGTWRTSEGVEDFCL